MNILKERTAWVFKFAYFKTIIFSKIFNLWLKEITAKLLEHINFWTWFALICPWISRIHTEFQIKLVALNFGFVEIIEACVLKSKLNTAKSLEKHYFNLTCFFFVQWYVKENLESLVEVSFELNITRFEINCKIKYVDVSFFQGMLLKEKAAWIFGLP